MATLTNHKFGSAGTAMDVWTDPGDLPNSGVTLAYNLYVSGTNFKSRPGINGLLTTPLSNPIYGPFPYVASGTTYVIFCSGPASSTTGGKIYYVAATGGTPTEILDATNGNISFNIDAESFRVALGGGYAYIVFGASIYRTNLSSAAASSISALNPPVVAPSASLSNIPLDTLSSTSGWSGDTIATNWAYTDVAIKAAANTVFVSSAQYPFKGWMVGSNLIVTSGTGFTTGTYPIVDVAENGVAIVSGALGTAGSTGGHASGIWTDLVILNPNKFVSSTLRPFQVADTAGSLTIASGTGFTPAAYTISAVFRTGIAELATSPGTAGSTAGVGTLAQVACGTNMVPYAQSDVDSYAPTSGYAGGPTIHGGNDIGPGVQIGSSWTVLGPAMSFNGYGSNWALNTVIPAAYGAYAATWMNFNDPLSGVQSFPLLVPQLAAPNAYRYVNQFYGRYYYYTNDTASKQGILCTVTAYADVAATIPIGVATDNFVPLYTGQSAGQVHDFVMTFPNVTVPILAVVILLEGAAANVDQGVGVGYPCTANFYFTPVATTTSGVNGKQNGFTFAEQTPGILVGHGEPTSAFWGVVAGSRITKDYGATAENWSASPVITYNLLSAPGTTLSVANMVADGLSMSLVLRQPGSTTDYIAPLGFAADGTYMSVDLSAYIPLSIYSSFEYASLQFNSNINAGESTAGLFIITSITQAGNLSIGPANAPFAPVTYIVEELDSFGDATYSDPLESSGGPISNAIAPSPVAAVGVVVAAKPVNTATTALAFFRGGGTFTDGLYRLIATVPIGSDYVAPFSYSDLVIGAHPNENTVTSVTRPFVAGDVGKVLYILAGTGFSVGPLTISSVTTGTATLSGAAGTAGSTAGIAMLGGDPLLRDLQNPYVTWNHTTMTLTDNTPDSFLNLALTYQFGRDLPPTSCTSVCYHQNRIWVASGQTLSSSWSLTADLQNGVYFTDVDLSTDPYAAEKGITFPIGYGDGDNIQSLVSTDSSLLVLKSRSAAVVDGYDPTNFVCQTYLVEAKIGCAAPLAAVVCGNNKAFFLGDDNVYMFDGDDVEPRGTQIQPLIHPDGYDGTSTISATAFGKSAMMYYNQRLFLFVPVAGGSANSTCFVYDFRHGPGGTELGWVQWGLAMTSGRALSNASNAYMGGFDGQLYTFAAGGDKATPASSPVGIFFNGVSRGMGQEQQTYSPTGETGMNFVEPNKCTRLYAQGKVPANTTLTFSCWADNHSPVEFTTPYLTSGTFVVREAIRGVEGEQIFVGISGTVLSQATIRMFGCEVAKRKVPS